MSQFLFADFETFYGDGYSLSLKDVTTESYIRDSRFKIHGVGLAANDGAPKWITGVKVPQVIERLPWKDIILVGHNLQFDGSILNWHFGVKPKMYIDTLALSRALIGPYSARHGLKYAAEILCNMTKMDELQKAYNREVLPTAIENALADYTIGAPRWNEQKQMNEAGDIILTREIFRKMIKLMPKKELYSADWTIRAFTDPKVYLDTDLLEEYIQELAIRKRQVLINAGLETRDLLMSNDKYAQALEELGVTPPTKVNGKGKITFAFAKTDEAHKALLEHDNPDVQALVAARIEHKSTIEETRAKLYLEASKRGPWPVGYNYAGAQVTQRLSGNKGGGGNPQNLKRKGTLRRTIYAPEGQVLGVADLSQIEARIVLWIGMQIAGPDSEEARALEVMRNGGDIYAWFGSKIYGYTITKDTHPHERQVAKSAVLGLGYGMGPGRFIEYCKQMGIKGIDVHFAEDIVRLYRGTFVGVRKFWAQCQKAVGAMMDSGLYEQADDKYYHAPTTVQTIALPNQGLPLVHTGHDPIFNGYAIRRPNGLYIKYPDLEKDPESGEVTYRDGAKRVKLFGGKICENIVQAIAADIIRDQLVELNKLYEVVMTTHDELVCLVPEDEADIKEWDEEKGKLRTIEKGKFTLTAEAIMKREISYMPGLPLDIECDTAIRYGDAK